jgi:hypothetical protein
MEMDAEALRACCKCVVEHVRRLLGRAGTLSTRVRISHVNPHPHPHSHVRLVYMERTLAVIN